MIGDFRLESSAELQAWQLVSTPTCRGHADIGTLLRTPEGRPGNEWTGHRAVGETGDSTRPRLHLVGTATVPK